MRIKTNGITLNVLEQGASDSTGKRPTLVFLHYFGGSSQAWTEVINRLSTDYHCIAPDLRGFGESDAPPCGYSVKDYADDVGGLIAAANVKTCVLVGHSMGGKIALSLAARRPANLHSLVLLAPSPPTPEPMPEEERTRLLTTHGNRAAVETLGKITAHPVPTPLLNLFVEDNLRSSQQAWRAWLERGSREDISADMTRIDVPVLIVAGGMDESLTAKLLRREVVRRIGGARLTTLPDVAHLLPLENPAAIAELIHQHCQFCGRGNKTPLKGL